MPAVCCTSDAQIIVSIQESDEAEPLVITDWKVDSVKRETEGDISTFRVVYSSDEANKHDWKPDAVIVITVQPKADSKCTTYRFEFTTKGTKNAWYDYLKVWEGHKNNWYDYGKVWENSVVFEQVK